MRMATPVAPVVRLAKGHKEEGFDVSSLVFLGDAAFEHNSNTATYRRLPTARGAITDEILDKIIEEVAVLRESVSHLAAEVVSAARAITPEPKRHPAGVAEEKIVDTRKMRRN